MKSWCDLILSVYLGASASLCLPARAQEPAPTLSRVTTERLLLDFDSYDVLDSDNLVVSPDLRRLALGIEREDGTECILLDGKEGPAFKKVEVPFFSPDGSRLAYVAVDQGRARRLVVDGVVGKAYDAIESVSFSRDGRRFGYKAKRGGQTLVIVDDKEHGPFPDTGPLVFSPNGLRFAFGVLNKRKQTMVFVDDNQYGPFADSGFGQPLWLPVPVVFSPDSSRFAIGVFDKDGKPTGVIVDGKQVGNGIAFSGPRNIVNVRLSESVATLWINSSPTGESIFGPDSKRLTYVERQGDGFVFVIDDSRPIAEPCSTLPGVQFSPDGTHVAVVCSRERPKATGKGKAVSYDSVYLDGKLQAQYERSVANLTFSPDGRRLALTGKNGQDTIGVLDGKEIMEPSYEGPTMFSPDSSTAAWTTLGGLVVNGVKKALGPEFANRLFSIFFSPDSKRLAFATADHGDSKGHWDAAIVDDRVERYSQSLPRSLGLRAWEYYPHLVGEVYFSPDSRHTAYWACEGAKETKCFVVGDGIKGPLFETVLGMQWDSPSALRYLAIRDDGEKVFEVQERFDLPK